MEACETFFSYLNSLDDDYYFFLANTVLGRIPTPFHKPVLNQRIISFLLNEENRQNILRALDREERKYLSFILLASKASAKDVGSFFSEDSYILVATRLSNLTDRLILLKNRDSYLINPVLEDLIRESFDADLVFGTDTEEQKNGPFADRNILFAVTDLLIDGSTPVREASVHHFLKSGRLKSIFPQFSEEQSKVFFSLLRKLLISEGAVNVNEGRLVLDRAEAQRLLELDPLNLMVLAVDSEAGPAIARILGILKAHCIPLGKLGILFQIIGNLSEQKANDVLKAMECFGFFIVIKDIAYLNQAILEPVQQRSPLKVDSDLNVSFFGTPEPDDILFLFSDVCVCDKLITYNINKDSFFRALEIGLDSQTILSYLGSGPEDRFSVWQDSFSRLRLYDGILINCDKDIRAMIEQHPNLKTHIIRSFGDDMLLMKRSTFSEWQESLAYALDLRNLPIVTALPSSREEKKADGTAISIDCPDLDSHPDEDDISWEEEARELLEFAKAKGCSISEVQPLIEDKLIVSKSQIDKGFKYAGRIVAGALDYNAKLSAIKSAIPKAKGKEADILKIELPSETLIVQPVELIKAGPSSNVLRSKVLPEGTERSIPVSSIFQVTVLKWNLR